MLREPAAARRTPGKIDVPAVHSHSGPALGKPQVPLRMPTHVLARGVDQLELQMIHCAAAAQAKTHRILLRHPLLQRAARDYKAPSPFEIEIHLQGRQAPGEYRRELQLRVA